jgi:hypothetical protein
VATEDRQGVSSGPAEPEYVSYGIKLRLFSSSPGLGPPVIHPGGQFLFLPSTSEKNWGKASHGGRR